MQECEIDKYIERIELGDEEAREELIRHYQPYILNVVGHICHKYKTWSDEETSIGLIAFNKAIETYRSHSEKSFLNYVYLLIKRDLIDYFRKEQHHNHARMNEDSGFKAYEVQQSLANYSERMQGNHLVEEILELSEMLHEFGVAFEELEKFSPKHRDTRETLFKMAREFIEEPELILHFNTKKRLPASLFAKKYHYSLKTIEKHRKYLIMLIIVHLHSEWTRLLAYIQQSPEGEGIS